ncbi:uncharacterized protein [Dermacentor albipictus]|uniref:uncharacterized protein n=1 Tax=Dermacentor albipictus TaxID=60249 RepID=UPI0038FD27DA
MATEVASGQLDVKRMPQLSSEVKETLERPITEHDVMQAIEDLNPGEHIRSLSGSVLVFKVLPRCLEGADAEQKMKKRRLLNRKLTATLKRMPCLRILNPECACNVHVCAPDCTYRSDLNTLQTVVPIALLFFFPLQHRFLNASKEPRRPMFADDRYHVHRGRGIDQLAKIVVNGLAQQFGHCVKSPARAEPGAVYKAVKCCFYNTKGHKSYECVKFCRPASRHLSTQH